MDKLRQRLLESTTKPSDLIEIFSAIDKDRSGRITFDEFHSAIRSLQLDIKNDDEIKYLFRQFDTTNNGQIDLFEFLQQLRPTMNERRQQSAITIFNSMDMNKDGTLTIVDLKMKYAVQLKSKSKQSVKEIDQIFRNFLNKFDTRGEEDGIINKDEFLGFCLMLSATIKEDIYFEYLLRSLFDIRF